jgi:uncharacterized protein (DUF2147 family)
MRALLLPFAFGWSSAALATPSIEGLWLTDDRKGIVRIAPCGAYMCGRIAKVLDSAPNVPKTDIHNPDQRLRSRTILGLPTLTGFRGSGSTLKGGRAYDPKSGKSYRSSLQLEADGSLRVTGCVLFICESRRWTRAH